MKKISFILLSILLLSCDNETIFYTENIIENNHINKAFLSKTDNAEQALITGYLYAYGNEVTDTSTNVKAQILNTLQISNECDSAHLNNLKQWFKNDVIMFYKLKNCPNLPIKSPIQNGIKHMNLHRHNDTLQISILVYGLNNSQEKNWNSTQTETFLINENTFEKLNIKISTNSASNCLSCQKNIN